MNDAERAKRSCLCGHLEVAHVRDRVRCLVVGCECPEFRQPPLDCSCGHRRGYHIDNATTCMVASCSCRSYRPNDEEVTKP